MEVSAKVRCLKKEAVVPAQAGPSVLTIKHLLKLLDSRLRGNDESFQCRRGFFKWLKTTYIAYRFLKPLKTRTRLPLAENTLPLNDCVVSASVQCSRVSEHCTE